MADKVIQLKSEDGLDNLFPIGVQEFGDNYIKFTNGIMVEWGLTDSISFSATQAWGSLYETSSTVNLGDFSEAFLANTTPIVLANAFNGNAAFLETIASTNTSIGGTWLARPASASNLSSRFSWIAIGKWK